MIKLKRNLAILALSAALLATPTIVDAKPIFGKETVAGNTYEQLDGDCYQEQITSTYFFGIRTSSSTSYKKVPC